MKNCSFSCFWKQWFSLSICAKLGWFRGCNTFSAFSCWSEAQRWSPFRTLHERLPLSLPSILNRPPHGWYRRPLGLARFSLALFSSWPVRVSCSRHCASLFCCLPKRLEHEDKSVAPPAAISLWYSPNCPDYQCQSTSQSHLSPGKTKVSICRSLLGRLKFNKSKLIIKKIVINKFY